MRAAGLAVALTLALALLPTTAMSQEEGQTTFRLETHAKDGQFYFTFEGEDGRNPALVVSASTLITVTIVNMEDVPHNFCYESDQQCSEYVEQAGDEATYTFTSPASGTADYWCLPHKAAGMRGIVRVAGTEGPGENGTPGFAAAVAVAAIASVTWATRRR